MDNVSGNMIDNLIDNEEIDEYEASVMDYIVLLHPDDKLYLNFKNIYNDGNQYISNYRSDTYSVYVKERNLLLDTYSIKKNNYYIESDNDNIKVFKLTDIKNKDKMYQASNLKLVKSLKKPKILVHLDDEMRKMKNSIIHSRSKLQIKYKLLVNDRHLSIPIKKLFIKERDEFSKKLNLFYTYLYYYNKMNGILSSNQDYILNKIIHYFPENVSTPIPRLSNKTVNINPDIITKLNDIDSTYLDNYYNVIQSLGNNSISAKDQKTAIKEYLLNKDNNKDLMHTIDKKKTKTTINMIIL